MVCIHNIYWGTLKTSEWRLHQCWDRRDMRHTRDSLMYINKKCNIFLYFQSHGSWKVQYLHRIIFSFHSRGEGEFQELVYYWPEKTFLARGWGPLLHGFGVLGKRNPLMNDLEGNMELGHIRTMMRIMAILISQRTWVIHMHTLGWWFRKGTLHNRCGRTWC